LAPIVAFVPRPGVTAEHRLFPKIIAKQGQVKVKITCQDQRFAHADDFCDFFMVLRRLKTEHFVSKSMVFRLLAQSTDLGTRSTVSTDRIFYR